MVTSLTDRNAFFDELDRVRLGIALPLDDTANLQAAKHFSHRGRQHLWGEAMIAEPTSEFVTARHLFNILMQMSGTAKRICYFAAIDQADYLARKVRRDAIGIDMHTAVAGRLVVRIAGDAREAHEEVLREFEEDEKILAWLPKRIPQDFGQENSPAVASLRLNQQGWAQVATSSILMAMGYRDGVLANVPVLEPKSISDEPQIYYPFAIETTAV